MAADKRKSQAKLDRHYASKTDAVDAYLRRIQSMGPDKVLTERIKVAMRVSSKAGEAKPARP